jgi:hypothetical protein
LADPLRVQLNPSRISCRFPTLRLARGGRYAGAFAELTDTAEAHGGVPAPKLEEKVQWIAATAYSSMSATSISIIDGTAMTSIATPSCAEAWSGKLLK